MAWQDPQNPRQPPQQHQTPASHTSPLLWLSRAALRAVHCWCRTRTRGERDPGFLIDTPQPQGWLGRGSESAGQGGTVRHGAAPTCGIGTCRRHSLASELTGKLEASLDSAPYPLISAGTIERRGPSGGAVWHAACTPATIPLVLPVFQLPSLCVLAACVDGGRHWIWHTFVPKTPWCAGKGSMTDEQGVRNAEPCRGIQPCAFQRA